MKRKCSICGRDDANILCSKCHEFICENCYNEKHDSCIKCVEKESQPYEPKVNPIILRFGVMILFGGLMTTIISLIPLTGARVIVFPFIFEELNALSGLLVMLTFITMFSLPTILPWYLNQRNNREWDSGIYTINDSHANGRNFTEKTKLMITTEIPNKLVETVYFEDDGETLTLLSSKDSGFKKMYPIPENYSVETVQYEYEKNYLILQVNLAKNR